MNYLFYVMGGGLGHLSRVSAFIFTQKIPLQQCFILSSSSFTELLFDKQNIIQLNNSLEKDTSQLIAFIQEILKTYHFEIIYLDTFPQGIIGELTSINFNRTRLVLLARDLNWKQYKFDSDKLPIHFEITYVFEELDSDYFSFLQNNSKEIKYLKLDYPPGNINPEILNLFNSEKQQWLIVHSMPEEEVLILLEYAQDYAKVKNFDANFTVITQCLDLKLTNATLLDYFPAYDLFPYVDKIITASGFNLMQQTLPFKEKHICIPFSRKYDRQNLRLRK